MVVKSRSCIMIEKFISNQWPIRWDGLDRLQGLNGLDVNPHTTHNSSNRSDEGLTLETSAFLHVTVANLRFQLSWNSIQEFIALVRSWTYGNWIRSWGTRTILCHLLVFCKLFFLSTPWTRIQGRNFKLFELKLSCQTEDNLELLGNSERLWNIKLYSGVHIHLVSFFISLINWLCSSFLLTTCIVIDWQPRICTFTKVIISFHRFNWQVVTFI